MKILAIETSCDETAIAILDIKETKTETKVSVLGNALISQVEIHEQYGGVYPALAKREHSKNLVPILKIALRKSKMLTAEKQKSFDKKIEQRLKEMLSHEQELFELMCAELLKIKIPKIDMITVTNGPGLEPALWVGINFAKALNLIWDIPVIPANHMEGHLLASLLKDAEKAKFSLKKPLFPMLTLLISGGHTELVLTKKWSDYRIIGQTRDDAVGEAFDKVARMLSLPYPGGPHISRLAEKYRKKHSGEKLPYPLPRPMINSKDFDFSFAGLKTAVLYTIKKIPEITDKIKESVACEFENSATEVLISKSAQAIEKFGVKTFALGGGVSANKHIRETFKLTLEKNFPETQLFIPSQPLTTDNAIMIGLAGYFKSKIKKTRTRLSQIRAEGNMSF
jgi:N6-L-threonylcarbamoyladenine synthase